jgi:CBS domain-containing protein
MDLHVGQLVVIEARPLYSASVEPETERPDEVQPGSRVRAKPDHVTRIRRDFRLEQDDVQWHKIVNAGPGSIQVAHLAGDSRMQRVKHLLARKGKEVWSVDVEEPVLEAIQIMADRQIGALPVTRNGELAGIISERDYARKVILLGRSSAETQVWEIMSSPVITVSPNEDVRQCMQLMTEKRIRHLPVVADGQMVGVISIGDLVRAVIEEQDQTIEQLERFIAG